MKLSDVRNYILEKNFEIHLTSKYIDIVNYTDIGHFDTSSITIYYDGGSVLIKGSNMTINKLLNNEVLIVGKINTIELR